MDSPAFLPHFYVASDPGLQRWRVGIAVNNDFGTLVDWGIKSNLRFLVAEAGSTCSASLLQSATTSPRGCRRGQPKRIPGGRETQANVLSAPPPFRRDGSRSEGTGKRLALPPAS